MKKRNFNDFSQLLNLFFAAADITVRDIRLIFHLHISINSYSSMPSNI